MTERLLPSGGELTDENDVKPCGAWGGCTLPAGHNQGKADIPENHRPVTVVGAGVGAAHSDVNDYPLEHQLSGVPAEVLNAARSVLSAAVVWHDVDPDQAEPLADAVVLALLPWLRFTDSDQVVAGTARSG